MLERARRGILEDVEELVERRGRLEEVEEPGLSGWTRSQRQWKRGAIERKDIREVKGGVETGVVEGCR